MNEISNYVNNYNYTIPSEVICNKTVPSELLAKIFSLLCIDDLPSTVLVSQAFKEVSICKAKHIKLSDLVDFCTIMDKHMDALDKEQIKILFELGKNHIVSASNLSNLKLFIQESKTEFSPLLHKLPQNAFDLIQKENKSKDYDSIIFEDSIRRRILQANLSYVYAPHVKDGVICKICWDLADKGYIEWSVNLAKTIDDYHQKSMAIQNISSALLKQGEVDKAVEVAYIIPPNIHTGSHFGIYHICAELLKEGKVDKVLEIASKSPYKNDILHQVCTTYYVENNVEEAIKLAGSITDEPKKNMTYVDIALALSKKKNFARALQVADKVTDKPDGYDYFRVFYLISKDLYENGNKEQALELLKLLPAEKLEGGYPFWKY